MNSKRRDELEHRVLSGDTDAIRRYTTEVRAYDEFADPQVLALLLKALENAHGLGSRTIILNLPVVPEIENALVKVLESGYDYIDSLDGPIHIDAIRKLAELRTPTALEAIRRWVIGILPTGEANSIYAAAGLLLFAAAGDITDLPFIRNCLENRDIFIRSAAIQAVGMKQDRESVPKLIALLSDKSQDPRFLGGFICDSAAIALGQIGDVRAVEPIATMIEHRETSPYVDSVVYALTKLDQPGFDALRAMLDRVEDDLKQKIVY